VRWIVNPVGDTAIPRWAVLQLMGFHHGERTEVNERMATILSLIPGKEKRKPSGEESMVLIERGATGE